MTSHKTTRILTRIGCSLLFIMAAFHASGIFYINTIIQESNLESFLKEIFGVLFAHPSVQLFALAALGILSLSMKDQAKKVLFFIAILVAINAVLAFYLGAFFPGILLLVATLTFTVSAFLATKQPPQH